MGRWLASRRTVARFAHRDEFVVAAADLTESELGSLLGVSHTTLRRWRDGRARIPWAAYQLAYEHSRYGLAERDAIENFNRSMLAGELESMRNRVRQLEAELTRLALTTDWGCANDPFTDPADPRSVIQIRAPTIGG